MNETVSRKYILILSLLAGLVLALGVLLKPKKVEPVQPSPSETASLQRAVRREELDNQAETLAERAASAGRYMVYVDDRKVSGVIWGATGNVVTPTNSGAATPLSTTKTAATQRPPRIALNDPNGRWLVFVGRSNSSDLFWTAALDGGARASLCGNVSYQERITSVALGPALFGAGVFDLDGGIAGMVIRCRDGFHVAAVQSFETLLIAADSVNDRLLDRYGIKTLQSSESDQQGLIVEEISKTGPAWRSGIRAGDSIISVGETSVNTDDALWKSLAADAEGELSLTIIRPGSPKPMKLLLSGPKRTPGETGLGIRVHRPEPPAAIITVSADTPAYRTGLRTGDAVVQVGSNRRPTPVQLEHALDRMPTAPLLIVFERGERQRAVWIKP